jgi:4-hydroxybenzoate polyprenyltransferase
MTSSYLAVLVLALYMHAPEVETHYARPEVLWWVLPCVLYWISRIWLLAARGELKEDAIAFALRDGASYATAIIIAAIALIARPI